MDTVTLAAFNDELEKIAKLPRYLRELAKKTEGTPRSPIKSIDFDAMQKLMDAGRMSPTVKSKLMGRAKARSAKGYGAPYADETAFSKNDIRFLRDPHEGARYFGRRVPLGQKKPAWGPRPGEKIAKASAKGTLKPIGS